MAPKKLTEYERKRLETIRRNSEMMASLKLHSTASQLSAAAAAAKRTRAGSGSSSKTYKVRSPEKKKAKTQELIVIRRSLRTQGLPPDSKGLDGDLAWPSKNSETHVSSSPQKPSIPRQPVSGPITMKDAYAGTGSDQALKDIILSVRGKERVFPSKEEEKGESLDGGIEEVKRGFGSCVDLGSMDLKAENVARLLPERIMVVKFLPCEDMRLVVAGNKCGNVAFWHADSRGDEENGIFLYKPHTGPISGILFQQSCLSKIFTSCYDGCLRLMDAEKEEFDLVHSNESPIFSLSQRPDDMNNLYFGEGRGGLSIWDERAGKLSSKWTLHRDRINSIDFNSQNPHIMATSSTDSTVCLWDLRSINADKPKSLKTLSHDRAVHSAYFSPSASFLATTSADDTVGILRGANFEDTYMIEHFNQTGRWLSSFRATWGWDDSYIFIGNMKRGVDVISPTERRVVMTLQSPNMSAIPCRFDAHPYKVGTLAGATSGGQVYMWTSS